VCWGLLPDWGDKNHPSGRVSATDRLEPPPTDRCGHTFHRPVYSQAMVADEFPMAPDTLNAVVGDSAAGFLDRLERQIAAFQGELPQTHQVLVSVFLPGGHQIIAGSFGREGPQMIVIDGTDERGRQVRLLAAGANLHIVLTAVKRLADRPAPEIRFLQPGGLPG
jgi:hypothetical protein